ncbi:MAG: phosphate ABC transporter permease PstA [Candidatus Omnitrophica bacterium]|nr:phosphate ABC transporter permease PstA [Candidatus Omnitrophota bacterium]
MNSRLRLVNDRLFFIFAAGSGTLVLALLLSILVLIASKGIASVSWDFITQPMRESGAKGGVLYQIAGTLILVMTTSFIVIPISTGCAIFRSVYLKSTAVKKISTLFLYVLNGIPSVLFGLFGFFVFVKFLGMGKSWLTGGILLAMMILPLVTLSLSESIERIPAEYIENARSIGLSRQIVIYTVILPQSASGLISGILLGLARAAGETAPIMFTATIFSGASFPKGVSESPVLTLPYHILNLAQESYRPEALQNAWGSATVLIMVVVVLSLLALPFRFRSHEESQVL